MVAMDSNVKNKRRKTHMHMFLNSPCSVIEVSRILGSPIRLETEMLTQIAKKQKYSLLAGVVEIATQQTLPLHVRTV